MPRPADKGKPKGKPENPGPPVEQLPEQFFDAPGQVETTATDPVIPGTETPISDIGETIANAARGIVGGAGGLGASVTGGERWTPPVNLDDLELPSFPRARLFLRELFSGLAERFDADER